jgi:small subunit ribosomal protein S17
MKTVQGKVVSVKMTKTVVVEVIRQRPHPLYRKIMKHTIRLKAHNTLEGILEGDKVELASTRPLSRDTHYKVVKKLS